VAVTWKKLAYEEPVYRTVSLSSGTFANTSNAPIEVIALSSTGSPISLTDITGERDGLIKVLVAGDSNLTIVHDNDYIKLRGSENLSLNAWDVVQLVSFNGVWIELNRVLF
jgi:hypothetical protein